MKTDILYDNISMNSSWNDKIVRQNLYGKSKYTFYIPEHVPQIVLFIK